MKNNLLVIIMLIILNIFLLIKVYLLNKEFGELTNGRVTLTISEQMKLLERELESQVLKAQENPIINKFRKGDQPLLLLYHFQGDNCRRCMNMELKKRMELADTFKALNKKISSLFVFSDFEDKDFITTSKQYGINSLSVNDTSYFQMHNTRFINSPIIMLLDRDLKIIYAYLSNYKEPERMESLYQRIFSITNLIDK